MSKAAELAALIGSQTALSNRNLIINGAMQVSQRGDSTGVSVNGFYASDRFKTALNSIGTWNVENSSDAPAGFSNSHKLTCTTPTGTLGAADQATCSYRIEAQDLQRLDYGSSAAKFFTISFYVKSNKTGNASLEISQKDTASVRSVLLQYNISAANTWEYKEFTVAGDTAGQIDNDNGEGMQIVWWLRSGADRTGGSHQTAWYERVDADRNASNLDVGATANDTWQITGVQLEVGEQATPFEHRSYGDELARCQRYYYQTLTGAAYQRHGLGVAVSTSFVDMPYRLPQTMRTRPSTTKSGSLSVESNTTKSVSAVTVSTDSSSADVVRYGITCATSVTVGYGYYLMNGNDANAYITFDAEL